MIGVEQNDNSIIEMSLKLACIYGIWKQHEKAKIGYLYCIKTQENKMKSGKYQFIVLLHKIVGDGRGGPRRGGGGEKRRRIQKLS